MAVEYIGKNAPDGMCVGLTSSEKLAFYGSTPVARQSLTVTTVATTVSISTTSAKWGFSTSTQANQIIVAVKELLELVATVGLGG